MARALRILFGLVALMLAYDVMDGRAGPGIIATVVIIVVFADVLARTREARRAGAAWRPDAHRAEGPAPRAGPDAPAADLLGSASCSAGRWFVVRRRLRGSARTARPWKWRWLTCPARGGRGDPGVALSGAFGGLLGSVPREEFLSACNAYLRRGPATEGFVTAMHLALDLITGDYVLYSAGHPPRAVRRGQRDLAGDAGARDRPGCRGGPALRSGARLAAARATR